MRSLLLAFNEEGEIVSWKKALFLRVGRLPAPISTWAGKIALQASRRKAEQALRRLVGDRWQGARPGPMPPQGAIMKTNVLASEDAATITSGAYYFASGYQQVAYYAETLAAHGFNAARLDRLYEIGCGSGRLLRHWRGVAKLELVGSDVDADNIAWCKRHLDGIAFHVNALEPPLAFLADASVDIVVASSVFTHIDLDRQPAWLAEMARILRPGGFLLADVHGAHHRERMLDDIQKKRLAEEGGLVIAADDPTATVSTRVIGSCDTFQTEVAARRAFGECLEVLEYRPRVLDSIICRKPD